LSVGNFENFHSAAYSLSSMAVDSINNDCFFWYWPLNKEGLAKCNFLEDKFQVELACASVCENRMMEIKSSERKNSLTVGLCPIKSELKHIWEVTVQTLHTLQLVIVELKQEMRDRSPAFRKSRTIRKSYRLPDEYDIDTLNARYCEAREAVVVEARKKSK
ncbi:hypothetical protein T4B_10805, partial [Trichinella pseudospiralis]